MLPFASEETLSQLEQNVARCGAMTDMLHEGCTPRDITERLLLGLGVSDSGFSLRPRFAAALTWLTPLLSSCIRQLGTAAAAAWRVQHLSHSPTLSHDLHQHSMSGKSIKRAVTVRIVLLDGCLHLQALKRAPPCLLHAHA